MKKRPAERMTDINSFYVMELLQRAKILEKQGRDIIHMEIGEPDFDTPETIVTAGINYLRKGNVKYTEAAGLPELRECIAQYYQQRFQVSVPIERIFITPGASGALLLALAATLNPGEKLLMADPGYPCNRNLLQLVDAVAELIPVNAHTHYQLSADLVERYWSEQARAVLIASPSNPTGTIMPSTELEKVIAAVNSREGFLLVDEIYQGLVYEQDATTALQLNQDIFVINSFSKYFGMTGWRIGWLIVPSLFVPAIQKLAQNIFIATSTPAQYAALAAFDADNLQELERRRVEFVKRRDYLYAELIRLGFDVPIKPDGAFYIYVNCEKFTQDSFQFAYELLESEGVAVAPGRDFGQNAADCYLRFAYTTSIDRIAQAVQRIEHFINSK